jgi:DNA excision repair protein ERCC-2
MMDTDTQPKQIIKMSVRNLVEFILRSGDIDNRKGKAAEREAMQEGSRIHRKIQRRMGTDYYAEVPLKTEIETENYILRLEGRADGIIRPADKKKLVTIDEIKGVYRDVQEMEEAVPVQNQK